MNVPAIGATIPPVTHHRLSLEHGDLHYVAAGDSGAPILLVHGFPESWWTFSKVIPLLARQHRVFAVDLPGFGDSDPASTGDSSVAVAEDLHRLIAHLGVGPVHLTVQDIAGGAIFRLAAMHPHDIASVTAIEMGLAGFGLEGLADVTHGGAWHIGVLAAPSVPEMLLVGRERDFLGAMFQSMVANPASIGDADMAEFVRTYSRAGGWRGAAGLYRAMLREGAEIHAISASGAFKAPVLAIGGGGGDFTFATMSAAVGADRVRSVRFDGVGHYVALEAPERLAETLSAFVAEVGRGI